MYFIAIFLLLYIPFLKVAGISLMLPYVYIVILLALSAVLFISRKRVSRKYLFFIMLQLLSLSWYLVVSFIFDYLDKEFFYNISLGIIYSVACLGLSCLFSDKYKDKSEDVLLTFIFYSGVLHSIIMIVAFSFPSVSNTLYTYIPLGEKGRYFIESHTRSPGLTGGGGDHLSVIQAVCFLSGYILFTTHNKTFTQLALYSFGFVCLLASILLSARTGFVILFLGIALISSYKLVNLNRFSLNSLKFKSIMYVFFSLVASLILMYVFLSNSGYERLFNRSFELVLNYVNNDNLSTSSTTAMRDMYFIPDNFTQFSIGSGMYGRSDDYYLNSDIGYVRILFGSGILGVLIFFSPLLFILKELNLKRKLDFFIFVTLVSIFVMNFKTVHYFYHRETFKILIFSFGLLTYLKEKKYFGYEK